MPVTGPLTEKEISNGKMIFEELDQDNDGKISSADLKKALEMYGLPMSDEEIEGLMFLGDADGSGFVDWPEFMKVMEKRPIKTRIVATLRKLFDAFDTDKSGTISPDELRKLIDEAGFDDFGEEEMRELLAVMDTDGDGVISFEEFIAVMVM